MEIWEREGPKWGRLINETTSEKSFWEPTFVPWGMEPEDMINFHRQFYREFYFRPVTLARHLETINSWRDVAKYVQASNLFSFLFYNAEKPSLSMVKSFAKTLLRGGEQRQKKAQAEYHEYVG